MDARGGKILEFLKENSHLDLEIPDIAFNVKKSERTVEAALKKFQLKGLVTARQNEFGRVYWYALPSAPITKILKAEELLAPDPEKESGDDDEAIDLASLPKSKPKPKKSRSTSPRKKTATTQSASRNVSKDKSTSAPETVKMPAVPPQEVAEEATFEPAPVGEPVPEPVTIEEVEEERFEAPVKKTASGLPLQVTVGIVALLAVILGFTGMKRGDNLSDKIATVEKAIPTDVVASAELKALQDQVAGMAVFEEKLDSLTVKVDSLTGKLSELTKKKTVRRRRTRRRR